MLFPAGEFHEFKKEKKNKVSWVKFCFSSLENCVNWKQHAILNQSTETVAICL